MLLRLFFASFFFNLAFDICFFFYHFFEVQIEHLTEIQRIFLPLFFFSSFPMIAHGLAIGLLVQGYQLYTSESIAHAQRGPFSTIKSGVRNFCF